MKKQIILAAVLCCLALAGMVLALTMTGGEASEPAPFVPPEFDPAAQGGAPADPGESWMPIYKEGMAFSAHVCGQVLPEGNAADLYFTNDAGNTVWMKLRILDEKGNILGETGLLKPGQYVQAVTFNTLPKVGDGILMKIMAYEPDTYYSAGSVMLQTVFGK